MYIILKTPWFFNCAKMCDVCFYKIYITFSCSEVKRSSAHFLFLYSFSLSNSVWRTLSMGSVISGQNIFKNSILLHFVKSSSTCPNYEHRSESVWAEMHKAKRRHSKSQTKMLVTFHHFYMYGLLKSTWKGNNSQSSPPISFVIWYHLNGQTNLLFKLFCQYL